MRKHDEIPPDHRAAGTSTLTRKGQITIPAEIRGLLGLELGDRLSIRLEGRTIVINRAEETLDRLYGILGNRATPPRLLQEQIDTESEAFEQAVVDEVMAEMDGE